MKRTIIAAVLFAFGAAAYAGGNSNNHHNTYGDTYTGDTHNSTSTVSVSNSDSDSYSNSRSNAKSSSNSGAYAGGSNSNAQGGASSATSGASSAGQSSTMSVVNQDRLQAPAASAPALTSGSDTCMGSSSAGGSGPGFGFSVGSTWSDEHCKMLKSASILWNMGMERAAIARLCVDDQNREALEATGYECPALGMKVGKSSPGLKPSAVTEPYSFKMVP